MYLYPRELPKREAGHRLPKQLKILKLGIPMHLAVPDWIIQLSMTTLIEIDMTTSFVLLSRL
jgi:hypothetical protein